MTHIETTRQTITKDFADEAQIRNFIFHHVLKNNAIMGCRREINQEHLYSVIELSLVLNIAREHFDTLKELVQGMEIFIHSRAYYSLFDLIAANGFIQKISPLTNFAAQE